MVARRLAIAVARPSSHLLRTSRLLPSRTQIRCASQADIDDPDMASTTEPCLSPSMLTLQPQNGGYINPPREKRQFRDPYADWWDKQERRNYGEPVHEDNDILGMFSPEEYTHFKPGKGIFLIGCWVASVLGLCGVVSLYYPDKPSAPRTFPGGLDKELGGAGAVWVSSLLSITDAATMLYANICVGAEG